jgi:hypothetical protein
MGEVSRDSDWAFFVAEEVDFLVEDRAALLS